MLPIEHGKGLCDIDQKPFHRLERSKAVECTLMSDFFAAYSRGPFLKFAFPAAAGEDEKRYVASGIPSVSPWASFPVDGVELEHSALNPSTGPAGSERNDWTKDSTASSPAGGVALTSSLV